jgi:aldehyde dehydrogenase (NAD+)
MNEASTIPRPPHEEEAAGGAEIRRLEMYIDGTWRAAASGRWFETRDPCTDRPWALLPRAGAEDVAAAVEAAHAAFTSGPWPAMSASDRGLLLYRLADLIAANAEHLADLEVRDNGKLMLEMLGQMRYLPRWFQYYGGLADKIEGSVTPIDKPGLFHYVVHEPVGVVGAITPWNSPLLLTVWKIAPALAAGNTIVVKPSEFASASMLGLARLFEQAGVPKGVLNVVTGFGEEAGKAIVDHPLVRRIAFTGSDAGGAKIAEAAGRDFKRVSLELGGKSANIIFADADIDAAANGVISGIFAAAGQTCMAGSRLLVHASVHDAVVERILARMKQVKIGDPRDPATEMGPVATEPQLHKVLHYIDVAKAEGARCVLGGMRSLRAGCESGYFVEPTVFVDVTNDMRIAQEEVFGPVLSVIRFETDEEAIRLANDSRYGLAAAIWTSDMARALHMPKRLHAGTVWVNAYRVVSYLAPFGGVKASGIGRENGAAAIMEYLEPKSVFINPTPAVRNPFTLG